MPWANEIRTEVGHREIGLWRGVILQAIVDCVTQSKRLENVLAREEALQWFNTNDEDFMSVCHLAELHPEFVVRKMQYALKNQDQWRRSCDIGKGKQYLDF